MTYFDRIDVSEGNDVNEASKTKERGICHYRYFLNKWFTFQPYACNRYFDWLIISINLSNVAILKIKNADYSCITTQKWSYNIIAKYQFN